MAALVTRTKIHMCMNVRGALKNMSRRELSGLFTDDAGRTLTADQARDFLLDEVAKGHKVIPLANCDNFDYQTGCKGHAVTESDA